MLAGLTASVGTVGDAYDNALAETTIGLYKTECTRAGSPFRNGPVRTLADLEDIARKLLDAQRDAPAVHGLEHERAQDEQIERALQKIGGWRHAIRFP